MIIKITPLDTLLFRTGRPFSKGEDTWTEVIFPPYPSTLYGAIRSFLIFHREGLKAFDDRKYSDDIGTPDTKGSLKIKGPILYKDNEMYFTAPLDLVKEKNNEHVPLEFSQKPPLFTSDYHLNNILIYKSREGIAEPEGWLSGIELKDYLKSKKERFPTIRSKEFFLYEPKVGITRERGTLTAKEGHLYRISLIRLKKDVSLISVVDGVSDLPEAGLFQLGGERKGAKFEAMKENVFGTLEDIELNFENRLFKIYLATPAVFNKGWFPKWIDEKSLEGNYNGIKLKLIGCAVGKPILVGGWDIAKRKPKPLQKAVPAGSVYYFEILDNSDSANIKESFHLSNISDINPEEGFGLALVGEVKL